MSVYTTIVMFICMAAYAVYGVWQITQFRKRICGVLGTGTLIAGSVGVYLISPLIAAFLLWLIKAICVIAVIALIIMIFGS